MMWKKPVSKFKNASPDDFNRHPSSRLSYSADCVSTLTASVLDIVWASDDGSVSYLPSTLDSPPRRLSSLPPSRALSFSPFLKPQLASLSSSDLHILRSLEEQSPISISLTSSCSCLSWNRSVEMLVAAAGSGFMVVDLEQGKEMWKGGEAAVRSIDWDTRGATLFGVSETGTLERADPREKNVVEVLMGGVTGEVRVKCCEDDQHLLVSGQDKARERQVKLYDLRSPNSSVATLSCGRGKGAVELLYERDTGMLFTYSKGDTSVAYNEVLSVGAEPLCHRNKTVCNGSIGAATLAPRLGLDLMQCEAARLLFACGEKMMQARYRIPRKAYTEFYPDIYEASLTGEPSVSVQDWRGGTSFLPSRAHLTPKLTSRLLGNGGGDEEQCKDQPNEVKKTKVAPASSTVSEEPKPQPKRRVVNIDPGSKFKHIEGRVEHKDNHFPIPRKLEGRIPAECEQLVANDKFVAYQVVGAGTIQVQETTRRGRVFSLEHGCTIQAFVLDQLVATRMVVGCSDGRIRVWDLTTEKVELELEGHSSKLSHVLLHPSVLNLLLSASLDVLLLHHLPNTSPLRSISLSVPLVAASFTPRCHSLVTIDTDGFLTVWPDIREAEAVMSDSCVTVAGRTARVVRLHDGAVVVSGFVGSKKLLSKWQVTGEGLQEDGRLEMDTASSYVMTLTTDVDKQLIFGVTRGDRRLRIFDMGGSGIVEVASFTSDVQLQGFALLSPLVCDVKRQEVAKGFLLTQSSILPISFFVPRVKIEYFHDDLFPQCSYFPVDSKGMGDADIWWKKELPDSEPLSLRPASMPLYSTWKAEEEERRKERATSFTPRTEAARREPTEKERQAELVQSMRRIIDSNALKYGSGEQADGVDSDEWED